MAAVQRYEKDRTARPRYALTLRMTTTAFKRFCRTWSLMYGQNTLSSFSCVEGNFTASDLLCFLSKRRSSQIQIYAA